MECETDFEITSLANSITLTPGTITVHVEREHRTIVIHAIDVGEDPDAVRRDDQERSRRTSCAGRAPGGWPPRSAS